MCWDIYIDPYVEHFRRCTIDTGALVLLEIWAWSRIPILGPQLERLEDPNLRAPFRVIWCTSLDLNQLPTHVLLTYQDQLDFMPYDQVELYFLKDIKLIFLCKCT